MAGKESLDLREGPVVRHLLRPPVGGSPVQGLKGPVGLTTDLVGMGQSFRIVFMMNGFMDWQLWP